MANITKSELAALKLTLLTEYNTATRSLTDSAIIKLAHQHNIITATQRATYLGEREDQPQQEEEKPKGRASREKAERRARNALQHAYGKAAREALEGVWTVEDEQPQQETKQEENDMTKAAPSATQADLLAQLMATMQPQTPAMDDQHIIDLINEHSPVRNLEIKTIEGKKVEIEQQTHECFERSLTHLQIGNQLYFYGRSGAGKSTTAKFLAKALDVTCYIQGAILAKFEALGSLTANGYNKSIIRKWLENPDGGLLCIDEIDASCPRALVTLMSIFDLDGELSFPDGETFKRTEKHLLIVTANTVGAGASAAYMGRTRLDKATLNRFVQIEHDYSEQIENTLAPRKTVTYCRKFRDAVTKKGFDGALITPRTILQAGKVETSKLSNSDKSAMVADIVRQGLTEKEYSAITGMVGAY